jgi:hypothetical protein
MGEKENRNIIKTNIVWDERNIGETNKNKGMKIKIE